MEVYYERIQKLVHGLQLLTKNNFLTTMFRASLQSYLKNVIVGMKQSTLQHKEAVMLCEEGMTTTKARSTLLVPQSTKHATLAKTQNNIKRLTNIAQIVG